MRAKGPASVVLALVAAAAGVALAAAAGCATAGKGQNQNPDASEPDDATTGDAAVDTGGPVGDGGGGCDANTATDYLNCGSCGHRCATGQSCSCGICESPCSGGMTSCCGVCLDTTTDPANCGTCGHSCLAPAGGTVPGIAGCASSTCNFTCPADAGATLCEPDSGSPAGCYDLTSSSQACGACGTTCTGGKVCTASKCVTPEGGTGTGYTTSTPKVAFLDACSLPGHKTVLQSKSGWAHTPLVNLPTGFAFKFYGATITQVWLQNQGTLGIGPATGFPPPDSYPDCKVFDPTTGYGAAVAFGDPSLATGASGVCYAETPADGGTAGQFAVTWEKATLGAATVLTFSVVLHDTSNVIDFQYKTAADADGGLDPAVEGITASVGLRSSATATTPYSCHTKFLTALPLTVRFTPK